MNQYLAPFLVGVGVVAIMIAMFLIGDGRGYQRGYDEALNLPHLPDTVWRTKIVYKDSLIYQTKWMDREKLVYVPVDSLVYVYDTAFVAQPMEHALYSDENLEAQVSGIQPTLDWYKIHQPVAYITNTVVEQRKWSFGVSGGAGVFWDGKEVKPGAGIILGIQRRF